MLFQIAKQGMELDYRKHYLRDLIISNPLIVDENRSVNLKTSFYKVSNLWVIKVEGSEIDMHGNLLGKKLYISAEMDENKNEIKEQINFKAIKQANLKQQMEERFFSTRLGNSPRLSR